MQVRYLSNPTLVAPLCLALGLAVGLAVEPVVAAATAEAPTEHKGLSVTMLGKLSEETVSATTGLDGYFMQLRAITIEPGGQIATHSHENRPGLVKVTEGEWTEGRPDGERTFAADGEEGILEDENTTHWFFNRGDQPATAIVCDLSPVG